MTASRRLTSRNPWHEIETKRNDRRRSTGEEIKQFDGKYVILFFDDDGAAAAAAAVGGGGGGGGGHHTSLLQRGIRETEDSRKYAANYKMFSLLPGHYYSAVQ
jgi:hypothetical protein